MDKLAAQVILYIQGCLAIAHCRQNKNNNNRIKFERILLQHLTVISRSFFLHSIIGVTEYQKHLNGIAIKCHHPSRSMLVNTVCLL